MFESLGPKKLREYLDSDFPMFSKMVSDENVEKIAKSKIFWFAEFSIRGRRVTPSAVAPG